MSDAAGQLAVSQGKPLGDEQGIGALTLGGYLREVTERFAGNEAVVCDGSGNTERWTYEQLWDNSVAVARALIAGGLSKDARVGLLMTNRMDFLSGFFGVALAGGVATPISTFFTAAEIDEVLQLSGCAVLLYESSVLKKDFTQTIKTLIPGIQDRQPGQVLSSRYPFLRYVAAIDTQTSEGAIEGREAFLQRGAAIDDAHIKAILAATAPSDPGALFFSSGSTGRAKGILSSHRAACLQLWRWKLWWGISTPPRTWSANGFFFSGNFCMAMGGTLSSGGTLVLQRFFDAGAALELMGREAVSLPLAWPHQWSTLAAAPNFASVDLFAMQYVDPGTPFTAHPTITCSAWRSPDQAYGSTEGFTLIAVYPAGTAPEVAHGSHGVPTAGTSIKIIDPFTGHTLETGQRGEIAFKGPTLMLGYLGIPMGDILDHEGYFRTGDGGYIDGQGRLFWEGRLNDIIKTGGANVSPLEIDQVIREYPGIKFNQTVGVPDDSMGELVVTCVVPHPGITLSQEEIQAFAKIRLASFKVPRRVLFFAENEFKTTGSAKIKTADLRKLATQRLGVSE